MNQVKLLLNKFLSPHGDQENESKCKPLHIRIFYAKQNLSIGIIQGNVIVIYRHFAKVLKF